MLDGSKPYGAYISRVFNFANFANLESFAKFIQRKFEPLRCNTYGQHEFAKFIQRIPLIKAAIRENLDPRNISAIRYVNATPSCLGINIG